MPPNRYVVGPANPVYVVEPSDDVRRVAGPAEPVYCPFPPEDQSFTGETRFGNYPTSYAEFEEDGTLAFHGDATVWDDLEGALIGQQLDSPAGRIDFNFTELTVDFQNNCIYPTDLVSIVHQMRHRYEYGTALEPHLHTFQNQDQVPNWLIAYRIVENGGTVGGWTLAAWNELVFTYVAGTMMQIIEFPAMPSVSSISFAIQVKLFRDTTNISGLFAGADPYVGTAAAVFFDIHFVNNTLGSREEFVK